VSTPDARMALESDQDAWAHAKAARPEPAEDTRNHEDEIMAAHPGRPTPAEACDRGVTPASGG
jgi:hypothetical protein